MNAFDKASQVEARGMQILRPHLSEISGGRYVLTAKGTLARHLQLIAGDALINTPDDKMWGVEIKVESRFTGNLYLETWSNRNLSDKESHADRGMNPGWLIHCRADVLLYYFLDTDDLFTINLFRLKRWAFGFWDGTHSVPGRIYDFEELVQRKHAQKNETCGRIVPISRLKAELGGAMRQCKVRQVELLPEAA